MESDDARATRVHRAWMRAVAPLAIAIVVFAAGEAAARFAIWWLYGAADFGAAEPVDYAPYLMTVTRPDALEIPPREPGTFRVLVVGSSVAAAIEPDLVEEAFQPLVDRPVDVVNLGQGGHVVDQELVTMALYGLDADPDLVLTIDGLMDIVAVSQMGETGVPYVDDDIRAAVTTPSSYALGRLFDGSQLVNGLRKLRQRQDERNHLADPELQQAVAEHLADVIPDFSVLASGTGAAHVAVLQPYLHLRTAPPPEEAYLGGRYLYRKEAMIDILDRSARALEQVDWPDHTLYIDARRVFDDDRGVVCFRDEAHLTADGRRLLLRHVADRVRASGLIERSD
jgi:hypothetical protein